LLRNAITWSRSATVERRSSTSSNTSGSGQKVTVVPVRPRGALPVDFSGPFGTPARILPPRWRTGSYSCTQCLPSRSISSTSRRLSAFTTDTPTPCSPPDTL
jgi:hypothetical protein